MRGDMWTLWFDPHYRNRKVFVRLIPQIIANAVGLHRPFGQVRCALGIYPKPPHYLKEPPCGWCGRYHGRRWVRVSDFRLRK
jgi:hypothetical protein